MQFVEWFLLFFIGSWWSFVYHDMIHANKFFCYLTGFFGLSTHMIKHHTDHHKYFLTGKDFYFWPRYYENFYAYIFRCNIIRRKNWLSIFDALYLYLTLKYCPDFLAFQIGFIVNWELFEYWSHYALPGITKNKQNWSWNILSKGMNKVLFNTGKHSFHHTGIKEHLPILYSYSPFDIYRAFIPNMFFSFMDKSIILNIRKGYLKPDREFY